MRLFTGERYGRPITDWKHRWVPDGTQPHRPVLGRPVDAATLQRIQELHRKPREARAAAPVKESDVPLVPPRTANPGEIPRSALQMYILGGEYGWAGVLPLGAFVYYQTAVGDEACVLRLQRDDLGAVGVWERRSNRDWKWVQGFTRCRSRTEQVGSEQLKAWLRARREICPDCGASSATHREGECP